MLGTERWFIPVLLYFQKARSTVSDSKQRNEDLAMAANAGTRRRECRHCELLQGSELQADQVLDQVTLLVSSEPEVHAFVVMVDYGIQISEASVMIEAAGEVG